MFEKLQSNDKGTITATVKTKTEMKFSKKSTQTARMRETFWKTVYIFHFKKLTVLNIQMEEKVSKDTLDPNADYN